MKLDWTTPGAIIYVEKPLREPTWWERGSCRYLVLSWSLWSRNIWSDLAGRDDKGRRVMAPVWAPWKKI